MYPVLHILSHAFIYRPIPTQTHNRFTKTWTQVRHLEKEMGKYKKEARAAKQELRFEQSIPSAPVYEHNEPGHTTPLFGNGGPDCGASLAHSFSLSLSRVGVSAEALIPLCKEEGS